MKEYQEIFCFFIDNLQYAFPLKSVDRIIQAVSVRIVPNSPALIYGLMDFYGDPLPVINLRNRLNLPDRPILPSDYFVIANTSRRKLAIVIDEIDEIIELPSRDIVPASAVDPGLKAAGIVRCDNGIILIYDIETFISEQDDRLIQKAMKRIADLKL